MSHFAILLVLFATILPSFQCLLDKILLDLSSYPFGGRCLDGSPAGYYFEKGGNRADTFVISLQGGGRCFTRADCEARLLTPLGSSHFWPPILDGIGGLSTNKRENPDFFDTTHVFIPYCTGDAHTGQRKNASKETFNFYFDGHINLAFIMQELIAKHGIKQAKNVLVTGESAGGLGSFANLDFIAGLLPGIRVLGAPVAGWFFPGDASDLPNQQWSPPNDYPHWKAHTNGGPGHTKNVSIIWQSYFLPACVAAQKQGQEFHCDTVHEVYKYLKTSVFVVQNMYDSNQINYQLLMPDVRDRETRAFVEYFGEAMRNSTEQVRTIGSKKPYPDGMFLAACFDHTGGIGIGTELAKTKINGVDSSTLVGDWFWQRNKYNHIYQDNCTDLLPCNKGCGSF